MPLRSKKMREGAKGQDCTVKFIGVCNSDPATTVFAHLRDQHKGMAQKSSDISGADACFACHSYIDEGHGTNPIMSDASLYKYLLRAWQTTLERRIEQGVISVQQDAKPTHKPAKRKPKAQRQAITQRANPWPPKGSRKINSKKQVRA